MARLSVRLLGPLHVTREGKVVTGFESDKVRALLAYLAVETDRPQRRERLAGLLWPERPEQVARTNLRVALSNLRQTIGDRQADPPFLCISRQTIHFALDSEVWIDVAAFTDFLQTLARAQPAIQRLEAAIDLYHGTFLEGFSLPGSAAFEEWLILTRERLSSQMLGALRQVAGHYEALGAWESALHYARRRVDLDPWAERAQRQLMRLLWATGQRNAALAQYESLRTTLVQELGVEPEDETQQLFRHIRDRDARATPALPSHVREHATVAARTRAGVSLEQPPHNLPAPLTPFVGREIELAALLSRLRDPGCRLLTLLGPGGSGKTRLALQAARAFVARPPAHTDDEGSPFGDGVYFVSLAALKSFADVGAAVAEVFGFPLDAGRDIDGQLLDYLRAKRILLVLDNVEHLLAPPAGGRKNFVAWLVALLAAAPDIQVLATSRARLNLQAEYLFPVGGMSLPEAAAQLEGRAADELLAYDALALFCAGAARARPDFRLWPGNAEAIARVCRLVDGMPLAILLAAAWTETMPPRQIAARLSAELGQGLDLLQTEWRDLPRRQRTMRAVFDHSWRLLSEDEQAIVRGLSVFRGGFDSRAAQEVTGASRWALENLVHKSLLTQVAADRFDMHELLRQYLAGRLAQGAATHDAAHDRHSAYYLRAAQRWGAALRTEPQQAALREMDLEVENTNAAWQWAVEREETARLARAVDGFGLFYELRVRYQEGAAICRAAAQKLAGRAALSGDELRLLARLWTWQSVFVHRSQGPDAAREFLEQGLDLLDDPRLANQETPFERAEILWRKARLRDGFDREGARQLYQEALALYRAAGDQWGVGNTLATLGGVAWNLGDYGEARQRHEESLAVRRSSGDLRGIASSLMSVGVTALYQGQWAEARRLVQEGCSLRQEIGDRRGIADGLRHLGVTYLLSGDFGEAASLLEQSMAIYTDLGFRFGLEVAMLADAEIHQGHYEAGRQQARQALAVARQTGYQRALGYALLVMGEAALVTDSSEEAARHLQESVAVYRGVGQWDEWCRALATLTYAARGQSRRPFARSDLVGALRQAAECQAFLPLVWGLPALALLLADTGQEETAIEVYALAARHPAIARSCWFQHVAGRHVAVVAEALPPAVAAAARQRGRDRPLAAVVELLDRWAEP